MAAFRWVFYVSANSIHVVYCLDGPRTDDEFLIEKAFVYYFLTQVNFTVIKWHAYTLVHIFYRLQRQKKSSTTIEKISL